jgi:hypothetical protein
MHDEARVRKFVDKLRVDILKIREAAREDEAGA